MPRFVVLEHDHPTLHWDLMLEAGAALRTWRLAAPPSAGATIDATPLSDHRSAYLDYEGPVSGGRGTVQSWDAGTFEWVEDGPQGVAVLLHGTRLRGPATVKRIGSEVWLFAYREEARRDE